MFILLLSVAIASLFSIIAIAIIGPDQLANNTWIDTVFWSLIIAGASLEALKILLSCRVCRLLEGSIPRCRQFRCET